MNLTKKISSFQTMRLFASLGVVQFHIWSNYLGVVIGHPGTDFFLVIVGVLAALVQAKRIKTSGWWTYINARYIRLYLTYIPVFILVLVIKRHEATWDWVLRSFLFIPIPDRAPVIGATWMLSMFMLFYFIFSMAFLWKNELILLPIFFLWIVGIMCYTFIDWDAGLPPHWAGLLFNERNLEFLIGYAIGVILRRGQVSFPQGRLLFWVGLVSIIGSTLLLNINYDFVRHVGRSIIVGLPIAIFILGLATIEILNTTDYVVRVLTKPWLIWLGGTSYVLYLSHGLYLRIWNLIFPITQILVPFITIGALIVGAIGYYFWEEPLLKRYLHR